MSVTHDPARQRFELQHDGATAVAEYQREGNTIVLTHTHVPAQHRGQGAGDKLARTAFEYARQQGLQVLPECHFMAAWLQRHPEYGDLRAAPE